MPCHRALTAITTPLPHCPCHSADAAAALLPLTLHCRCRLWAARFCRTASADAATTLPTPLLCCHCLHAASATLPMPPPCCRRLRRAATIVAALPPPLLCCYHRHRSAATAAPALPHRCLLLPLPMPLLRCHLCPCTANAAIALPTIAALLLLCQRCHRAANADAALLPLLPYCRHRHCSTTTVAATLLPCIPAAHRH
jgi:hypothetical protein